MHQFATLALRNLYLNIQVIFQLFTKMYQAKIKAFQRLDH